MSALGILGGILGGVVMGLVLRGLGHLLGRGWAHDRPNPWETVTQGAIEGMEGLVQDIAIARKPGTHRADYAAWHAALFEAAPEDGPEVPL